MASNKIKGITIQIGADTLGLDSALKGIEQKSKKVTDELKDVNKTIKVTGDSAAMWEQKQKLLNTALEESKNKLKLLESAQEQVNKQFKDNKISEEQYRAFQREVEYAKSAVNKYEKELDEAKTKVKELGGATDSAAKEIDDFGDETTEAAEKADRASKGGLSAITVALGNFIYDAAKKATQEIVNFGKEVVQTGMTFESSMSSVAAISGATAEELEQLSAKAKQMGATTKYTAAESADAFGYMALAGWKVEDMLNGIDGVLNLAASSNMDLAQASDIVTDYLTAFNLTAEDSAHFVDIMTYAMANSNTTTAMLGEAYKNCAATAASMGYSVEETTAVLMTMANAGVKGGEAGSALNAIMTRLATDTKGCASELAEYNVNVYDAQGNMQSLSSILEGVSDHWETLTDQEQASLAKILAGTSHYSALQTIMSGLSDSADEAGMSFSTYAKALEECDDAAQDMSTTMIDNLQGDMTILDSAMDGMKLSLSDELNPAIRDFTQYITKEVPTIQKYLKPLATGASKFIKGATDALPVIKQNVTPAIEILGGALKNAYNGAKWLIEKLPGINSFVQEVKNQKLFSTLTEDARALNDSVKADIDKMNELRKTAKEQTEVDLAKVYKTESLYQELQGLVDENGKVKRGYEDRVKFIINELEEATGIEIQQIDGVIQEYDKLQNKITETIAKQKAQIFEKNYAEMYSEALIQNSKAASEIVEAQNTRDASKQQLNDYNKRIYSMFQKGGKFYNSNINYDSLWAISFDNFSDVLEQWKRVGVIDDSMETELNAIRDNYISASDTLANVQASIPKNNRIIEQYEKGEEAIASGNYNLAQGYFTGIEQASVASFGKVEDNVDEAVDYYKKAIDEVGKKFEAVTDKEIKYGDTNIKAEITELAEKMKNDGLSAADILRTGIIEKLSSISEFDTTALREFMAATGVTLGDILAQTSMDKMSSELRSLVTQMMYSTYDLINEHSINSAADARLAAEQGWDVSRFWNSTNKHAAGGYIGLGHEGIVAEAGPELIQVMNGGVKVTPLARTAHNTPIGAGGDTVNNYYYNSVTANVGSRYDVYKLAEDLDTAQHRMDMGRGR